MAFKVFTILKDDYAYCTSGPNHFLDIAGTALGCLAGTMTIVKGSI